MVEAFRGKDAIVLTTGHGLGGKEVAIVDAAIQAGVKRFIPSESGSNSQNQSRESAGMTWTAIATGIFLDL